MMLDPWGLGTNNSASKGRADLISMMKRMFGRKRIGIGETLSGDGDIGSAFGAFARTV